LGSKALEKVEFEFGAKNPSYKQSSALIVYAFNQLTTFYDFVKTTDILIQTNNIAGTITG
jgi:hypothetical protein